MIRNFLGMILDKQFSFFLILREIVIIIFFSIISIDLSINFTYGYVLFVYFFTDSDLFFYMCGFSSGAKGGWCVDHPPVCGSDSYDAKKPLDLPIVYGATI